MAVVAQGNPQLQTVKRQLPQTTEQYQQGAPFIRLCKKMQTFGFLSQINADTITHVFTPQLPAAPGFLRALSLEIAVAGGTAAGATYQPDAPFSYINQVIVKDINNTTIFQVTGFELYLINLFSGQVADSGMQNPTAVPSYVAPTAAGNFTFRLLIPFELNRSGYCSLAAASQATPFQVSLTLNPLAATGAIYNAAPANQVGQTITTRINQLFWGLNQGSVDAVHPDDLGASTQWTTSASAGNIAANSNTTLISNPVSGWLTTLICVLRDNSNTNGAGPARVASLPSTDLAFKLDGVEVYSKMLLDEHQDKIARNFGLLLNGNAADPAQPLAAATSNPGGTLTRGVLVWTFRDDVAETVMAADTLDELIHVAPGSRLEVAGTFGANGTAPFTLSYTYGLLVPTDNYGLPYTHLSY
jgi:hypothetical protein